MKLLLDENLPKRLKLEFEFYQVFTVSDMGWNGKSNGELLKLMIDHEFGCFLTFDKNIGFQQNFSIYTIPVLVLNADNNTYLILRTLIPNVLEALKQDLKPGVKIIQ